MSLVYRNNIWKTYAKGNEIQVIQIRRNVLKLQGKKKWKNVKDNKTIATTHH